MHSSAYEIIAFNEEDSKVCGYFCGYFFNRSHVCTRTTATTSAKRRAPPTPETPRQLATKKKKSMQSATNPETACFPSHAVQGI